MSDQRTPEGSSADRATSAEADETRAMPVTDHDSDTDSTYQGSHADSSTYDSSDDDNGDDSSTRQGAVAPGAAVTAPGESQGATRYREDDYEETEAARREEFGGFNVGADFFGWLVAIAMTVLLVSIVGAIAAAVNSSLQVDQSEAERSAGTIGLATAIALLVILMIGYYAGGYVAGRMSRYDGGRQGVGVWLIGLIVTIIAVGIGAVFGSQYNILDRVDLPSVPIPRDTLTGGGLIAAAAIIIGTLITAFAGGKVGQRYHRKVDRVGL